MNTIFLGALLVWFVCGLIASSIANSKGNDSCGGFLLGVLFGPLGIIVAAVMPTNPRYSEFQQKAMLEDKVLHGELKKCPFCAELIQREAIVCRYCGRDQPMQKEIPVPPSSAPRNLTPPQHTSHASAKTASSSSNRSLLILLVASIILLVICVFFVVVFGLFSFGSEIALSSTTTPNPIQPSPTPFPLPTSTPMPTFTPVMMVTPRPPVPRGQSVMWVGNGQQFKFTLLDFYRGGDALSRINRANPNNSPPPSGTEYVLFRVRVDYLDGGTTTIFSSSDFAVADSKNRQYSFDSGPKIVPPTPPFFDKEISIGGAIRNTREVIVNSLADGWMVFVFTSGDPHPVLVYGHPLSDYQTRVILDTK